MPLWITIGSCIAVADGDIAADVVLFVGGAMIRESQREALIEGLCHR